MCKKKIQARKQEKPQHVAEFWTDKSDGLSASIASTQTTPGKSINRSPRNVDARHKTAK